MKKREKKWERVVKEGQQSWIPEPKGLMRSARENANPEERYYFFRKGETGHCSVCGHSFIIQKVRHKDEIVCPHCKKMLKAINLNIIKTGQALTHWQGTGLVYPQVAKGHLVLTEYQVINNYQDGEIIPKCYPLNRLIFKDGKSTLYKTSTHEGRNYWKKTNKPKKPYKAMIPYYYLRAFRSYCDRKALDRCLKRMKLNEYIMSINGMIGDDEESGHEVFTLFQEDYDENAVKILLKNKMYRLASYVVFNNVKNVNEHNFESMVKKSNTARCTVNDVSTLLGVGVEDLCFIRQNDLSRKELVLYKKYVRNGFRLKRKELAIVRENQWVFCDSWFDEFVDARFTRGIGIEKLVNYIVRRRVNLKENGYTWEGVPEDIYPTANLLKDYWKMAESNIGDICWLPSDLAAAHDQQVQIAAEKKTIEEKKELRMIVGKIRKLDYKDFFFESSNGLTFSPFSSLLDIYKEGKANRNCIFKCYKKEYAEGKDVLLSIRKNTDSPYFAMEIRNGSVVQVRGMMNRAPDEDMKIALREYISEKHLSCPQYIIE